jgi:Ca2+-binding EF-hand superfamily protein
MEDEIEHDRRALAKLFARIDKDKSGQLTLHELIEGGTVQWSSAWNLAAVSNV